MIKSNFFVLELFFAQCYFDCMKTKFFKQCAIALIGICLGCCMIGCKSTNVVQDPYANSLRPSIIGEWALVQMSDANGTHKVVDGMTLCLPESPRNAVYGNGGVNLYNGTLEVYADTVEASPFASTMMAGPTDAMNAESTFFALFAKCTHIKVEEELPESEGMLAKRYLVLYNPQEKIQLVFTK